VGFGHCIGMCGPVAVSLALNLKTQNRLWPHLLYSAGRIVTYSFLGGIMGMSGRFTVIAAAIAGLQKAVMIFSGLFIMIMGAGMCGLFSAGRIFGDECTSGGLVAKGFRRLSASPSSSAFFLMGLVLGLLPCGPVYTALIGAARSGMDSPDPVQGFARGMLLMAAFGTGTAPAMVLAGRLADFRWLKFRDRIYKTAAFMMIGLGGWFMVRGILY